MACCARRPPGVTCCSGVTFFSPEVYTTNNKTNFKDPAYKVLGLGLATGQQGFTPTMTACLPACLQRVCYFRHCFLGSAGFLTCGVIVCGFAVAATWGCGAC